MLRRLAAAGCGLALLAASPAAAQTNEELAGGYPMTVTLREGDCSPDAGDQLLTVRSVSADTLTFHFGPDATSDDLSAAWNPATKTFRYERASTDEGSGVLTGTFSRGPDYVRLEIDARGGSCHARGVGMKLAPTLAAPVAPAPAPAPTTSGALSPPAPAAAAPAAEPFQFTLAALLGLGAVLLAAGGLIGWLTGRKPSAPPAKDDTHA